ncbi:MAG: hypothetical protein ACYC23_16140 [Limisphaerales bacterium]
MLLLLTILIATGAGCLTHRKQNRVNRQDKAGSTGIAVLSVAPWDSYADTLQATFKLSPEDALNQAIPDTTTIEEKVLNAFSGNVKAALPVAGTSSTKSVAETTGSPAVTTSERTEHTSAGDISTISFGPQPSDERSASSLPPSSSILSTKLGIDPMMKYRAANALYQEVQLINQALKNAAIDAAKNNVYIVRLQVSVMPAMRDEPYDAYSNISFFLGDFDPAQAGRTPLKVTNDQVSQDFDRAQDLGTPTVKASTDARLGNPTIIPLLVTDNIQSAIRSQSMEQLIQLGIALSAMYSGVGAEADLQQVSDKLRTTVGRDFNSTFTVGRASDNTLRVRFGAMQQSAGTYAMIPQTHTVTVAMAVPTDVTCVRLVAKTTMLDAERGKELPARKKKAVLNQVRKVLSRYNISHGAHGDTELKSLLGYIERNDYKAFKTTLNNDLPESLWVDLAVLKNGSQYASARIPLPKVQAPSCELPKQNPILLDDEKASTAVLYGGVGLKAKTLRGELVLTDGSPSMRLVARSVEVLEGGRLITLGFPSLAAYGLAKSGALEPPYKDPVLNLYNTDTAAALLSEPVLYRTKTKSEPTFAMSIRSKVVNSINGTGKLRLELKGIKNRVNLQVSGADVTATNLKSDGNGLFTESDVEAELNLSNLHPIANLVVTATDVVSKGTSQVVLPVVELKQSK